jgi:hypothetical protein
VDSSNEASAFCTLINSYNFFTVNCKFSLIQPVFVCSNSDFFFYSTFYRFVCFLSHKVKEKYRIIIKLCWWSTFLCAIESCFYQCNKQLFLFSTQTPVVFQKTIADSTASSQTSCPTNTLIFCFLYFRCKSCYSRNTKKNVPRNRESNPPWSSISRADALIQPSRRERPLHDFVSTQYSGRWSARSPDFGPIENLWCIRSQDSDLHFNCTKLDTPRGSNQFNNMKLPRTTSSFLGN